MTSTEENIHWLEERGYKMGVNEATNENIWEKGDVSVSINSLRNIGHEYFKGMMLNKERHAQARAGQQFEVISPEVTFGEREPNPDTFAFEVV